MYPMLIDFQPSTSKNGKWWWTAKFWLNARKVKGRFPKNVPGQWGYMEQFSIHGHCDSVVEGAKRIEAAYNKWKEMLDQGIWPYPLEY